ncbi:hypothetical protein Pfo_031624, partial [Paulownia fortunei]
MAEAGRRGARLGDLGRVPRRLASARPGARPGRPARVRHLDPEFEILIGLHRAPDHRLRVRDVAAGIGWEKSRVSHQVTRMVGRGLVARADCPADGRGSWVTMTTEGRRAVLAGIRAHTAALEELFWRPVAADADTLRSVSHRVLDALARSAGPAQLEPASTSATAAAVTSARSWSSAVKGDDGVGDRVQEHELPVRPRSYDGDDPPRPSRCASRRRPPRATSERPSAAPRSRSNRPMRATSARAAVPADVVDAERGEDAVLRVRADVLAFAYRNDRPTVGRPRNSVPGPASRCLRRRSRHVDAARHGQQGRSVTSCTPGSEHDVGQQRADGLVEREQPVVRGRSDGQDDHALRDGVHVTADVGGPVVLGGVVADQHVQAVGAEARPRDRADDVVEHWCGAVQPRHHPVCRARSVAHQGPAFARSRTCTSAMSSRGTSVDADSPRASAPAADHEATVCTEPSFRTTTRSYITEPSADHSPAAVEHPQSKRRSPAVVGADVVGAPPACTVAPRPPAVPTASPPSTAATTASPRSRPPMPDGGDDGV